jgi:hypothetical protein
MATEVHESGNATRERTLFDRLLHEHPETLQQCAGYKVIDIRAAAEQFHLSHSDTTPYDAMEVASNVAPPFPGFVMNADVPAELVAHGFGQSSTVIMTAQPFRNEPEYAELAQGLTQPPKWLLSLTDFTERHGHIFPEPMMPHFAIESNGSLVADRKAWRFVVEGIYEDFEMEQVQEMAPSVIDWHIAPCFFALTLLHCKGVSLREASRPEHHSKKVHRREAKMPRFEHHVIVIQDKNGKEIKQGELRAASEKGFHIVLGHFATYTEEAPLFGRITGKFWIPAHIRGATTAGTITSEYTI